MVSLFLFQEKQILRFLVCLSFLLTFGDVFCCVQVMVRCPPTDRVLMERIVLAARLQFGMLPVGVENRQIVRVFRRWLRRVVVLPAPWCGMVVRRLSLLRRMTVLRTLGVGKCGFEFDFKVWVFVS